MLFIRAFTDGASTLTVTVLVSLQLLLSVQVNVTGKEPVVLNVTGGGFAEEEVEPLRFQL